MLRRRKWLIMLVTALGTAAAAFLGMKQTPTYTANASVMIDPRQLQVTNVEQVISGMPITTATMATQIGLLQLARLHRVGDGRSQPVRRSGVQHRALADAGGAVDVAARASCSRWSS